MDKGKVSDFNIFTSLIMAATAAAWFVSLAFYLVPVESPLTDTWWEVPWIITVAASSFVLVVIMATFTSFLLEKWGIK